MGAACLQEEEAVAAYPQAEEEAEAAEEVACLLAVEEVACLLAAEEVVAAACHLGEVAVVVAYHL